MKFMLQNSGAHECSFTAATGFVAETVIMDGLDVQMMLHMMDESPLQFAANFRQFASRFEANRTKTESAIKAQNTGLRIFVEQVARMCKDGEVPINAEPDSEPFEMTDEDNFETLAALIEGARQFIERNPR